MAETHLSNSLILGNIYHAPYLKIYAWEGTEPFTSLMQMLPAERKTAVRVGDLCLVRDPLAASSVLWKCTNADDQTALVWVSAIGDTDTNTYVTTAVLDGDTLTLTRNDAVEITVDLSTLSDTDTNTYVTTAEMVATNTLRLTRNDAVEITVNLSGIVPDNDLYIVGATLIDTTLRLTRSDAEIFNIDLASINTDTDTNNYVTAVTQTYSGANTNLTITRAGLSNLTPSITQPAAGFPFAGQTINSGNTAALTLSPTGQYGSPAEFWDAGQPTRISPNTPGRHLVAAWIVFTYTADEPAQDAAITFSIERRGAIVGTPGINAIPAGNHLANKQTITAHAWMEASTYLEIEIVNNGAGNLTITNGYVEISRLN